MFSDPHSHSRPSSLELFLFDDSLADPALTHQVVMNKSFYGQMLQPREELHRVHQYISILQIITIAYSLSFGMYQAIYEYDVYYLIYLSQQSYRIGTSVVPILQMSKLRLGMRP